MPRPERLAWLLIASVVEVQALCDWTDEPIAAGPLHDELRAVSHALVLSLGGIFTVALATMFTPACLVLRSKALSMASAPPHEERSSWLAERKVAPRMLMADLASIFEQFWTVSNV